jgi:ParB-like chromosome segregation protein Spo0J
VSRARYSIDKLLAHGIQMFEDLGPDELAALGAAIGRKGALIDPVTITRDEILVDGHQRLRAMKAQGREYINAADVRIIDATAATALEVSIQLNVTRRHLTVDQKANLARRLQHERGWSQGKIAELFGVSRPAVNQWLNKPERFDELPGLTLTAGAGANEDEPPVVLGADGKAYPAKLAKLEKAPVSPWKPTDGHAFRTLHKLRLELEHEQSVAGLNPLQAAKLDQEARDVIAGLEVLTAELADLVLPPSYNR